MITKVYIGGEQASITIKYEIARKDYVIWLGFRFVGIVKTIDEAKEIVTSSLLEYWKTDISFQ